MMPDLITIIFAVLFNLIINILYQKYSKKRRILCNDEGWLPIETLPENFRQEVLLTDGESVRSYFMPSCNRKGQVTFSYNEKIATHWRKFPLPPFKKQ